MPLRMLAVIALVFVMIGPARAQTDTVAAQAVPGQVVGTLIDAEGSITLVTPGGEPRTAAANAPIHMNDLVETGAGGRAFILLMDDTELTLGENTQLTIDEYVFDEENTTNNKGRYSILRGAFLYTSGLIAKKDNPDVQVKTPYGSVGIRGTAFWGGDIDGEYGILVTAGRVSVQTERGRIYVDEGHGTSLRSATSIPARASVWAEEKIGRAVQTIALKTTQDSIRQKISAQANTQKDLRVKHKEYLLQHRQQLQPRDPGVPQKRIDIQPAARPSEPAKPEPLRKGEIVKPQAPQSPSAAQQPASEMTQEQREQQDLRDKLNQPFTPKKPAAPAAPKPVSPQKTDALLNSTPTNVVDPASAAVPSEEAVPETAPADKAPANALEDPEDQKAESQVPKVDLPVMGVNEAQTNELKEQRHMQRKQPLMRRDQQQKPAKRPESGSSGGF